MNNTSLRVLNFKKTTENRFWARCSPSKHPSPQ